MRFVRCISRHSRSMAMLACPPDFWDRIICAPLGVDLRAFEALPFREHPDPFTLTCVGRLAPEKVRPCCCVPPRNCGARAFRCESALVGDGPDREALQRQAARDGLQDAVLFEGHVDAARLAACYRESDAFVLTSLFAGIPIVLMEAMAQHIPCVAPRITGIPELIADGVSGLLFHPADVEDLLGALRRLMQDPQLRRAISQLGAAPWRRISTLRRNTQRFEKILRERIPARERSPLRRSRESSRTSRGCPRSSGGHPTLRVPANSRRSASFARSWQHCSAEGFRRVAILVSVGLGTASLPLPTVVTPRALLPPSIRRSSGGCRPDPQGQIEPRAPHVGADV